jgi:hypothetical protein
MAVTQYIVVAYKAWDVHADVQDLVGLCLKAAADANAQVIDSCFGCQ